MVLLDEVREHTGLPTTAPVDEASDWSTPAEGMCVQWASLGRSTLRFSYSWRLIAEELGTSRKRLRILGFLAGSWSSRYSRVDMASQLASCMGAAAACEVWTPPLV